jgi:fatty acid desaturase
MRTTENQGVAPTPQQRKDYPRLITVIFIFITLIVVSFMTAWIIELKAGVFSISASKTFFNKDVDEARAIYETRNILGYAEGVAITSIGLFLPLLVLLWNSSRDTVSRTLEKLIDLKWCTSVSNAPNGFGTRLDDAIKLAGDDLEYLRETGRNLRRGFLALIVLIVVFLVLLACANFLFLHGEAEYIFVVVLKGLSLLVILWLLAFLLIFIWVIQPAVRDTRYQFVFGLEKQKE